MLSIVKKITAKLPKWAIITIVVSLIAFIASGMTATVSLGVSALSTYNEQKAKIEEMSKGLFPGEEEDPVIANNFFVDFIDVGQADCTFVTDGYITMLIDAGNNADGTLVANYLKSMGVTKIDFLVGTHPHEDHIGGLDDIIKTFEIGQLIMPDVTANTKTFEDVLDAALDKGLKVHTPKVGETWEIGNAVCTVLSCEAVNDKTDLNEWSIVLHLDTASKDFLFMGDAQQCNEEEIMKSGLNYRADYLRCGHHGSSDSNSAAFVESVNPKYIIVSVGEDNTYGHPHREAKDIFYDVANYTLMTKDLGTITVSLGDNNGYTAAATNTNG